MPKDKNWKVLSSETILQAPWLALRADKCETPRGDILDPFYLIESRDWCAAVIFDEKNRVLLGEQYRHGLGKAHFELPGGLIDDGESPLDAARRETLEETGYSAKNWKSLYSIAPNPAFLRSRAYFFTADILALEAEPQFEAGEDIETSFFTKGEVLELLHEERMQQGAHLGAILLAFEQRCSR